MSKAVIGRCRRRHIPRYMPLSRFADDYDDTRAILFFAFDAVDYALLRAALRRYERFLLPAR